VSLKWLLDTNARIAFMKSQPPSVKITLLKQSVESVGSSVISLYELYYGVSKSMRRKQSAETLAAFARYVQAYPWTADCAKEAGRIRAGLERRGKPIGPHDVLIAAHAKTLGATLVTHNTREFGRIKGLKLTDWSTNG